MCDADVRDCPRCGEYKLLDDCHDLGCGGRWEIGQTCHCGGKISEIDPTYFVPMCGACESIAYACPDCGTTDYECLTPPGYCYDCVRKHVPKCETSHTVRRLDINFETRWWCEDCGEGFFECELCHGPAEHDWRCPICAPLAEEVKKRIKAYKAKAWAELERDAKGRMFLAGDRTQFRYDTRENPTS